MISLSLHSIPSISVCRFGTWPVNTNASLLSALQDIEVSVFLFEIPLFLLSITKFNLDHDITWVMPQKYFYLSFSFFRNFF